MAGGLGHGVRNLDVRPPLSRSRSHTLPNTSGVADESAQPESSTQRPARPSHGRSRSYLSPVETKPRNANTLPTEKISRLHLPGSSKHAGEQRNRHRHAQSHAEAYQRSSRSAAPEPLPHLVAGIAAEAQKRANVERHGTNTSDHLWHGRTADLKRMTSYRSGAPNPRDSLHLRATSDPKSPVFLQPTRKTSTEILLDRADARKAANRAALTSKDIKKMKADQEAADSELRDRLADIGNVSTDITRRLDYTYYALLEKLGNLVGTIQSFQNLSMQSRHLIENFEHETSKLDEDIRRRVKRFRTGFEERDGRVADLETRGMKASEKAKELGARLENARIIVGNWEKRESAVKRTWVRVWAFMLWTLVVLTILILGVIVGREWWFHGDPVAAALGLPPGGARNESLRLGKGQLEKIELPEEVKKVLEGIEERRRTRKVWPGLPEVDDVEVRKKDEQRLMGLDEL